MSAHAFSSTAIGSYRALTSAHIRATRQSSAAVGIACALLSVLVVVVGLPTHLCALTSLAALACFVGAYLANEHQHQLINRGVTILTTLALLSVFATTPSLSTSLIAAPLLLQVLFTEHDSRWRTGFVIVICVSTLYAISQASSASAKLGLSPETFAMILKCHALLAAGLAGLIVASNRDINLRVNLSTKRAQCELTDRIHEVASSNKLLEETHQQLQLTRNQLTEAIDQEAVTQARLNAAHEQLEQFAVAASHDLKEPVRTIRSFMQLVRRQLSPKLVDDAQLAEHFGFVTTSCASMHTLLEKLLAYQQTGEDNVDCEPVSVAHIFYRALHAETLRLQALLAAAPGSYACSLAQLTELRDSLPSLTDAADGTLGWITLPPAQAQTLMTELVRNALTFAAPDRPPKISCEAVLQDGQTILTVSDNGIGIEDGYREQVFTMFKRLHPREQFPGSGLGLPLCRRIVEGVGGTISLTSVVGEGTFVQVILPHADD